MKFFPLLTLILIVCLVSFYNCSKITTTSLAKPKITTPLDHYAVGLIEGITSKNYHFNTLPNSFKDCIPYNFKSGATPKYIKTGVKVFSSRAKTFRSFLNFRFRFAINVNNHYHTLKTFMPKVCPAKSLAIRAMTRGRRRFIQYTDEKFLRNTLHGLKEFDDRNADLLRHKTAKIGVSKLLAAKIYTLMSSVVRPKLMPLRSFLLSWLNDGLYTASINFLNCMKTAGVDSKQILSITNFVKVAQTLRTKGVSEFISVIVEVLCEEMNTLRRALTIAEKVAKTKSLNSKLFNIGKAFGKLVNAIGTSNS